MAGYGATVTLYARRIRGFQPLYYRTDGARWWAWNPMLCTWDGIFWIGGIDDTKA